MSRKALEEVVKDMDLTPDVGPILKLLGTIMTDEWHEKNGVFVNAEARKSQKLKPIGLTEFSDIEIRNGNKLYTFHPAEEGKPMVSIPIGMSDKSTPASIPKEWVFGALLDAIIHLCEGDPGVARYLVGKMREAIDNNTQVDEQGRIKVIQKELPKPIHSVEVAEMINMLKISFASRSKGTPSINVGMKITELEQITEETIVPSKSNLDIIKEIYETPNHQEEAGGAKSLPLPTPLDEPETDEDVHDADVHLLSDAPNVEVTEQEQEDEASPSALEGVTLKKDPVNWILETAKSRPVGSMTSAHTMADAEGVHVQTIKRAIDKLEPLANTTIMQVESDLDEGNEPKWVELNYDLGDGKGLSITCSRSRTGRYARGSDIFFVIKEHDDMFISVVEDTSSEQTSDAPNVEVDDDGEELVDPCADCGHDYFECTCYDKDDEASPSNEEPPEEFPEEALIDEPEPQDRPLELEEDAIMASSIQEYTNPPCANCSIPSKFKVDTVIGDRWFCDEQCYAEYTGVPVKDQGYYALQERHDEEEELKKEQEGFQRLDDERAIAFGLGGVDY